MIKRILSIIVVLGLTLTMFSGCGSKTSPAASTEKPVVLKFSDCNGPTSAFHLAILEISKEVEAKTNGRVKIEVYPSSQLGDVKASMEGVQMGTIDMCISNAAMCGSIVPDFCVLGAPFIIQDDAHAVAVVNGEVGQTLSKELAEKKMNIVGYVLGGFRNVFSTRPIQKLADFKGLKIRTMESKTDMASFNKLGAIATPMAYSELFTALQQKTVDAAENALDNVVTEKFYEVTKYVTLSQHFYGFNPILISNAAIAKIPKELQATFFEACKTGCEKGSQDMTDANNKAKVELPKLGVTIYDIDKAELEKSVASVYEDNKGKLNPDLVAKIRALRK